jgi:hypothetical protein
MAFCARQTRAMAQPDYVPVSPADRVRQTERLPPQKRWTPTRPGDLRGVRPPSGESFGSAGPDQGYALLLAKRFVDRLKLEAGETVEDALAAASAIALKRAARFGRAPVVFDLELAFTLLGYLGDAPRDLIEFRKRLVQGAAHSYWERREIADLVAEETLRLSPAEARARLADWKSLISEEG